MPRRSILSATERESLLTLPDAKDELIRHYTFNETDLSVIRQRRGAANRLGFAVQLCYLRFPGIFLGVDEPPFPPLLRMVAAQLKVPVESWNHYGTLEGRQFAVHAELIFPCRCSVATAPVNAPSRLTFSTACQSGASGLSGVATELKV